MSQYIIGLTGGIGSGKTAASDWFAKKGIGVVDADIEARNAVNKGSTVLNDIKHAFGDWVIDPQGQLNRSALRQYIFDNPSARKTLELITHPAIRNNITLKLAASNTPFTILVAPLLFEGGEEGLVNLCNRILVVDVPMELQKQRAAKRDTQSSDQIEKIIAAQISRKMRLEKADDIVDNSQDLPHLYLQLEPLYESYLQTGRGFSKS